MTSLNVNIFRVTGPLWGEQPVTGVFPSQRPVTRSCVVFFDPRLNKRLRKHRDAGDLRRHRALYDVIVMTSVNQVIIGCVKDSSPGHYQNKCWRSINWTFRNKSQRNIDLNEIRFTQNIAFKISIAKYPEFWPSRIVLKYIWGHNIVIMLQGCE